MTVRTLSNLAKTPLLLPISDGEPVCTSALVRNADVAGIYFVATLEDFRGRGAAVTWEAARDGIEHGCRFASLQASELGRPVYERMGFDTPLHDSTFAHRVV